MFDIPKVQGDSPETPIKLIEDFSFEDLAGLASKDPAKFEALRAKLCQDLIESAPENLQRRLNGLQFTIDMERKKSKTPLGACIKLSHMMHDSLKELQQALTNPEEYMQKRRQEDAQIIQFGSLETI